ncbi:citrate transporter [Corynebacterium suranareeae]|uniref:Citrate transporter n=1 Tax=Corynebacterium suranareeae TaxID=2506452 RepID=A0A160PL12_9CORY|nr:GntP family permease [Corynebacterium suranareeae]BAU94367.1 citrate transporter [Corynebacterium suranareeae]
MSTFIPLLGILISLAFLITMAYRGHSVVVIAPISAMIAVIFSGAPMLATYTQIFMPALGGFIVSFFPLFLAGAIFGRLMTVSGLAKDLAHWISTLLGPQRAVLATVIATALLTYGGVSAWVIAFTIYPIASALFREANIPKKLMPAAIALGIFTFATAALPGSPQIHNAIPTRFFNTTSFAAPLLGIIGAAITFGLGMAWLNYRKKQLEKAGEGYTSHYIDGKDPNPNTDDEFEEVGKRGVVIAERTRITHNLHLRGFIGLFPILVVVITNLLFVYVLSDVLDFSYLSEEKFGGVALSNVIGVWSVVVALVTAIIAIFIMSPKSVKDYITALSDGAKNAVLPVFTTASEVAYGGVIASLAIFAVIRDSLFDVSDNPVIVGSLATAVIAGITGSSSGGLTIAMQSFAEYLVPLADAQGISLDFLHRAMAMASVSFDSLPHNGAIVTLLLVTGMTHRQSYKDIGVVTVIVPFIGVLAIIALGFMFPALQ